MHQPHTCILWVYSPHGSHCMVLSSTIGVHQSMLETVVPKNEGSAVMIVGGKKNKRQVTSTQAEPSSIRTPLS